MGMRESVHADDGLIRVAVNDETEFLIRTGLENVVVFSVLQATAVIRITHIQAVKIPEGFYLRLGYVYPGPTGLEPH